MKPCIECVKEFGKSLCSHNGCCVFEDVPGKTPEQALLDSTIVKTETAFEVRHMSS